MRDNVTQSFLRVRIATYSNYYRTYAPAIYHPFINNSVREAGAGLPFPIANLDSHIIAVDSLPRRVRHAIQSSSSHGGPQIIRGYTTTWISLSRRFLLSLDELKIEVRHGTPAVKRFTASTSTKRDLDSNRTDPDRQPSSSASGLAQRARVCKSDLTEEFLSARGKHRFGMEYLFEWQQYQEKRVNRRHWGQAMLCNLDWDWDPSASLRRMFSVRVDDERKVSSPTTTFGVNSEKGTT